MEKEVEIGLKYDAGKPLLADMLQDFKGPLEQVSRVWEFGKNKYGFRNWRHVEDAEHRYTNALVRHLCAEDDKDTDDDSNLLHAAHVAWNALARLHFILESRKNQQQ